MGISIRSFGKLSAGNCRPTGKMNVRSLTNTATTICLIKSVGILLEPILIIPPAQCVSIKNRQVMIIEGLSQDIKDRKRLG